MELLMSKVVEEVELLEGDKWGRKLDSLPKRLSAQKALPAGKSIRVHLGKGLHHGHVDKSSFKSISLGNSLYYRVRNRAIELTGPLTVRELLQAIGDAQLFECVRNEVLSTWLGRHLKGHSEDYDDEKRPVDCIPLNPEFVKQFEGKEYTFHLKDGISETYQVAPPSVSVLDPPADVDPTAGMDLQAMVDLIGGEEEALDWILGAGSTWFLGLEPTAGLDGASDEEWTALWSEPFA